MRSRRVHWLLLIAAIGLTVQQSHSQVPVTVAPNQQDLLKSSDSTLAANKKMVFDFWREVIQAHHTDVAGEYMREDYIQHNPMIPTGRKPFVDYFSRLPKEAVKPEIADLVAIVAEKDMIVLARRWVLPDPQKPGEKYTSTKFDMFRLQNGKIAEHWDFVTKSAK